MSKPRDIWQHWPLSEVTPRPPEAVALQLQVGAALPSHFDDAIRQCSITKKMVCVVWTAPTYVVLEKVEPITDDAEKADLAATGGPPWELAVYQSFDVIPTADVDAWNDDAIQDWYSNLQIIATEKALRHFAEIKDLPLFVLDDSLSTEFPSSVGFSVGGIAWVHTRGNRKAVMDWAESEYVQLVSTTLLGAQMSQNHTGPGQ